MPVHQLKRRNQASRDRYHRNRTWSAFAQSMKTEEIQNLIRRDLATGEEKVINASMMNSEIFWAVTFQPVKQCLSMPSSVAWEAVKAGAALYTENACFYLETVLIAQKAAA